MNHLVASLALVGVFLSIVTIAFILLSRKRPAGMLAWIWAVLLFPYVGPLCYLLFGSERMYRRHLRRRRTYLERRNQGEEEVIPESPVQTGQPLPQLLSKLNLFSISQYEQAELLIGAAQFYPALLAEVRNARSLICIEFFIWRKDVYGQQLLDLLVEAAGRGVKVRVIADEIGCLGLPHDYFDPLIKGGGKFSWFNALQLLRNRWAFSLRNHRKLQIIDGRIAFVGGMNLGREYMGEDPKAGSWKDIQIKVTGSVVGKLMQTFEEDWFFATKEDLRAESQAVATNQQGGGLVQIVEDGPDSHRNPMILSTVALLNAAQQQIWFTAGYFFPQEPILTALKLCATRGVDVRILVPSKSDHPYLVMGARSYYEELLSYGVRIFEYDRGTHHAKVILVDQDWISVGSANLDIRSMRLNFELNLTLHGRELAAQLEAVLVEDFNAAHEMDLSRFRQRSPFTQFLENCCRLLGPIL